MPLYRGGGGNRQAVDAAEIVVGSPMSISRGASAAETANRNNSAPAAVRSDADDGEKASSGMLISTLSSAENDALTESLTESLGASSSSTVEDIDKDKNASAQCIVEYVDDVFADLKRVEQRIQESVRPIANARAEQKRSAIVRWMIGVRARLKLRQDTLAFSIALLDRYRSAVEPDVYQKTEDDGCGPFSIGAAAMMLASTLEEQFPPTSHDFSIECRNVTPALSAAAAPGNHMYYSNDRLRSTSWRIATALDFDLWTPHYMHFLRRFSKASKNTVEEHNLAKCFCERAMLHFTELIARYPPSLIAAAAVMLVRCRREPPFAVRPWSKTLRHYTGYAQDVVAKVAAVMKSHGCGNGEEDESDNT